jgi:OPA family glycerol-3-phosphate transporter-like MFS transporter
MQRRIFLVTYVTYALYYLARLNFSAALPSISVDLQYSKFALGLIGGAFSISYAAGQFINGQLVESFGAKRIAILGLTLSAIMSLLFSYADLIIFFVVIWSINGYAQSTGWPSVVKIISNWFKSGLGTVGGLFGSCFLVGNMIAWPLLGYIAANFGWRTAFSTPSLLLFLVALIFYLCVDEKPEGSKQVGKTTPPKSKFRRILFSKEIAAISLAYMLLQFVRSGFTLWAPSYIFEIYGLSLDISGYVAAMIPIGGIVGSAVSGWLSDRAKSFGRTIIIFMLILSLSLTLFAFYYAAPYSFQMGIILLFLSGLTLYGPHTLMVTVIPMEHNDTYGAASMAGFIDGVGYIGLTFADPFIGWIVDVQGWNGAVIFWIISSLTAALLVGGLNWSDMKRKAER